MATASLPHAALQPRPPGGLWPGAGLSLVVHAGLLAAIALGVSWQRSTPAVFSAELWSALPEVAAPRTAAPGPKPAPPAPLTLPRPAPPPPSEAPARSAADIALERERAQQREHAEREAQLKRAREAEAKRAKAAEEAALKRQRERERELQRQREEETARKAEDEQLEKQRQDNLKRLLAQAGGRSDEGPSGTGTAARNAAPSQQYGGILREHVRAQLKFDTSGLPPALETVVEIRATASGTVLSRQLVRRSGNDAWDNAVLRAIDAASPLPRDRKGTTPGTIEITFRPVD